MFELRITSLAEAKRIGQRGWPTRAITVLTRREARIPILCDNLYHLHVEIDDITVEQPKCIVPARHHLRQVLAFTHSLVSTDRLLLHCYAGLSRSPALGIAILLQHGLSWREAVSCVTHLADSIFPNPQLIRLIDAEFHLNGDLERHCAARYQPFATPGDFQQARSIMRRTLEKRSTNPFWWKIRNSFG